MRLFKSSNKSQASLERNIGTRDDGSIHRPSDSTPNYTQAQGIAPTQAQYSGVKYNNNNSQQPQPPLQQQFQQPQQQQVDDRSYSDYQPQPHPAPVLTRSPSDRTPAGLGDVYGGQQHAVSTVPLTITSERIPGETHYLSGRTQFGPSQTVQAKQEHRKSKRSLFGFTKDKKEDKYYTSDRSGISRTGSILKKPDTQSQYQQQNHKQTSEYTPSQSQPRAQDLYQQESSSETILEGPSPYQRDNHSEDTTQSQYKPSGTQGLTDTSEYLEDNSEIAPPPRKQVQDPTYHGKDTPTFSGPPAQTQQPLAHRQHSPSQLQGPTSTLPYSNQEYQQSQSATSSKQHLPYSELEVRTEQPEDLPPPVLDPLNSLRPPSQASFALFPPAESGLIVDSRPSTSNTQARYSVHSVNQSHNPQPSQHTISQAVETETQTQTPAFGGEEIPSVLQGMRPGRGDDEDRHQNQSDPRIRMSTQGEQGRNTPAPAPGRRGLEELDFHTLLTRHEELQAKYSKVKRYYFEREAQVTQLQNTVANQRLSMSKTSLDDAQYATRFQRLNGGIMNIAFNIRKDWRRVPNWISPACNRDASTIGTKEMTAVGRACISRWLYERVFERIFHPGIDPDLSSNLKKIERSIRKNPSSMLTEEQRDDLLTKITTWRLTTCEGLNDVMSSRQADVYTDALTASLVQDLGDSLKYWLNDPTPPGLEDNLSTIIQQALSIASNLPLESRDVCIGYFLPGSPINETFMTVESGMTPLTNPGSASSALDPFSDQEQGEDDGADGNSDRADDGTDNVEEQIREASTKAAGGQSASSGGSLGSSNPRLLRESKKSGFLGGFVNKKPAPVLLPSSSNLDSNASRQDSTGDSITKPEDHSWNINSLTGGNKDGKIRFAVFFFVEVRGKSALAATSRDSSGNAEANKNAASAGPGAASGGTAGSSGIGGVNVLVKAPVYSF